MEYNSLLDQLLDLGKGWKTTNIEINEPEKVIDIYLEYIEKSFVSPGQSPCPIYDWSEPRRIRHLDFFDFQCFLNFRTPRMKLPNGDVQNIPLDFADKRVSFSWKFETTVIDTLLLSQNKTKTAKYLNTTFDIVHQIMGRAVKRGLDARNLDGVQTINLDEKSYSNGHNYFTVLVDTDGKRVLDIIAGRSIESTEELLASTFNSEQKKGIKCVAMDMWQAFKTGTENILPHADIVHDKFHISKYLNKGVDETRKQEVKQNDALKKSKYLFLTNPDNFSAKQALKFEELSAINLVTSKAWAMKENFQAVYYGWKREEIITTFEKWYLQVIASEIKPMINVADTLLRHLGGIVNASITKITNSMAETMNSKIQVVKSIARGFKNIHGYRTSILFFNGGLNLYPR
jgi:transposase